MNFSNEMLFMAGFIIAIVILIQYLSLIYIKKQIKTEILKKLEGGKKNSGKEIVNKHNSNKAEINDKQNIENKENKENESYDIDTPEDNEINNDEDADSYVNPLKSVKNDDDTV